MKPHHGLIIGKFYPPHAGHKLLVQVAARQCERVTVIVMAASHESISLRDRVEWMREIHGSPKVTVVGIVDDVPVDYDDPDIWSKHVALMREALAPLDARPIDAVFTSEPYGAELARRFSACAVTVDLARQLAPISATRLRADVPAHWDFLEAPVRSGVALRVVVLGAESTGTTTLSRQLADHLRSLGGADALTRWVPEYGREYSAHKYADAVAAAQLASIARPGLADLVWRPDEFVLIAKTQRAMEEGEARRGGPVLVCDTDAFATGVWHERYVGSCNSEVQAIADERRADLYLLTDHADVPFEQDGLRDGEGIRAWMTQRFIERLQETGRRWALITGNRGQRLARAIEEIGALRAQSWKYTKPLG